MSINWKELELILSELPLENSYIQKVTEHSYNAFTLSLFSKAEKAWLLYIEIGTPHSRISKTDHMRAKAKQAQRFTQYLKAHIVGRKIVAVHQFAFDRAFSLTLENSENQINMIVRLFSGPGANIIITDSNNTILEALYRRKKRNEYSGQILKIEERTDEGEKHFSIREYEKNLSFNEFIDKYESETSIEDKKDELLNRLKEKRDKELKDIQDSIFRLNQRDKIASGYEEIKRSADMLSASLHLVKKGMESITIDDWERNGTITLPLDESLSPNENLEKYYARYRKDKKSAELVKEMIEKETLKLIDRKNYWDDLLSSDSISRLKKEANGKDTSQAISKPGRPGLYVKSNGWDLIVGRNAKENDQILRNGARGSDLWMHTRDFSGGYVFIKAVKDKSVPLPVLLDAASLAIHFSKAKKNGKADLYYTEVKYLRRIKGAKTGLIIPTQEKNLQATLDEERVYRLLGER